MLTGDVIDICLCLPDGGLDILGLDDLADAFGSEEDAFRYANESHNYLTSWLESNGPPSRLSGETEAALDLLEPDTRQVPIFAVLASASTESLYKALSPTGNPELATILKVVSALGLRLHAAPAAKGGA